MVWHSFNWPLNSAHLINETCVRCLSNTNTNTRLYMHVCISLYNYLYTYTYTHVAKLTTNNNKYAYATIYIYLAASTAKNVAKWHLNGLSTVRQLETCPRPLCSLMRQAQTNCQPKTCCINRSLLR